MSEHTTYLLYIPKCELCNTHREVLFLFLPPICIHSHHSLRPPLHEKRMPRVLTSYSKHKTNIAHMTNLNLNLP